MSCPDVHWTGTGAGAHRQAQGGGPCVLQRSRALRSRDPRGDQGLHGVGPQAIGPAGEVPLLEVCTTSESAAAPAIMRSVDAIAGAVRYAPLVAQPCTRLFDQLAVVGREG